VVETRREADGIRVSAAAYGLWLPADRPYAVLSDADGARWADLCLVADVDAIGGLDDTAAVAPPVHQPDADGVTLTFALTSPAWKAKRLVVRCRDDHLALRVEVEGAGDLCDVRLLGGRLSAYPQSGTGLHASGAAFRSIVSPEPTTPERIAAPASEPATIDVQGSSSLPGRGHWFFTPPPFVLAMSRHPPPGGMELPDGPWLSIGIGAAPGEQTFSGLAYEVGERSFWLRLPYEGATRVDGLWHSPWVLIALGDADPYAAIAQQSQLLERLGMERRARPTGAAWWREPIFCGWGEQCHLATAAGHWRRAADYATQATYDGFLAALAAHDVHPGTIVIDDRWERAYGSGEADPERWPDLAGWIGARHAAGQRVLLWWKAWAADGVDPALCITNAAGAAVTVDPTNDAYTALLTATVDRMLGRDGYDADGLKVDFTALTPSGGGLTRRGPEWGVELLHRLLEIIYVAAKAAKPDALVVTHAPNAAFADVTDMIRLNDVQRLDDPSPGAPFVEHMIHRARIVRAVLPDVLIDTDNWAMPDRATWREYLELQPQLGVPSLYYASHIDCSGEALTDDDYAALRETWAAYRSTLRD
jgi:hypothetical protein